MAGGRLGDADGRREVAGADALHGLREDQRHEPDPHRVGKGPQAQGDREGVALADRAGGEGRRTPDTGRVQLALNDDDLAAGIAFYTALLGTSPAKVRDGYANFAVAEPPLELVLIEKPGSGGTLNHLGVEVPGSDKVHAQIARLSGEGLFTDEEIGTTCCFATQDKVWVTGPGGERWEVYTVLADSPTFGTSPQTLLDAGQDPAGGCCGTQSGDTASACR